MSYNGPEVALYRPPSGSAVPYRSFTDEALCAASPAEWFELSDAAGDIKGAALEAQHELMSKGLKVCAGCPVKDECLKDASELDRYWTVRGGRPPEGLFWDSKRPGYKLPVFVTGSAAPGRKKPPPEECQRGHNNWKIHNDGGRRCIDCQKEGYEKRNKARFAKSS